MIDIRVADTTVEIVASGKIIQTVTFDTRSDLMMFLQDLTITRILQYVS